MARIVILGAGESGVGAGVLAKKKGFEVFVSDKGQITEEYKKVLLNNEIEFEEKGHSQAQILTASEVVKSPGIPDSAEIVQKLISRGTPVISEIEFAARYSKGKMICITGSNGKTTTTSLTYHILKSAGINVRLAGNIGASFAKQVAEENDENDLYYVLELSSFQLDNMFDFKADIAVLMNITPDHLDRYEYEMQKYVDSKFRITQNQTGNEYFIYCADDKIITTELKKRKLKARCIPFSLTEKYEEGAFINQDELNICINEKPFKMTIHQLALQGKHNLYNTMAAGITSRVLELRKESVRDSLTDFQGLEHRMESVASVHGIEFINDSKATNVNSTWWALESMQKPVIWIAGGVDKGNDYSMLFDVVKDKVKAIICLGQENDKIHQSFEGIVDTILDAASAQQAVGQAYQLATKGDAALLSPACASFDLFENYEDRGHQFKQAVKSL